MLLLQMCGRGGYKRCGSLYVKAKTMQLHRRGFASLESEALLTFHVVWCTPAGVAYGVEEDDNVTPSGTV